ncbi:zinc finger CCCH domain-containing protein 12-like [Gastrolobium bilobum]|uniref:zinc finger CCCH domain-containing protein 12-like n=1 Tax=Gastrolobium bilobum TaxID=150636 RepID=UPI002AB0F908|nr:zinc finger CCCH domain-containing protein 12-like [Gastrolobium bilobum]
MMDYSRDGNVVQIIAGENWSSSGAGDQLVWATEDDYRFWNNNGGDGDGAPSNSNNSYDQRQSKKSRTSQDATTLSSSSNNKSKTIGKMFFKTKLCCKFRAGTCPYVTNCNFAHSIDELRRPPPNWQEIVAANEEEQPPPMEEFQIPSVGFSAETQRSYKGRHCKKFYTEEGCPYGDSCTFLHDEQSKNRESVAISLGPGGYGGGGGGGGAVGGGSGGSAVGSGPNSKPSNWKTRICNKWEMTGYCPFGSKCHFAHGAAELHRYGGGLMEGENRDTAAADTIQGGMPSKTPADNVVASVTPVAHSDVYHIGVPLQRPSIVIQRPGQRTHQKWKGPDKISRIYGDWIDDIE